ncbi:unnamed protein product [Mytilus coruscus]|uniref:Reverse transcriptase domain-containing protein n=1 Tax=Mytilus coruscus TaxID=42192 RepID=A0A6J8ER82_MYTCO|nr:unnamed protein product [Mytilus coruscus]
MSIPIVVYLDDGWGTAENSEICENMALQVKSDLEKSGFVVNNHKSIWTPVQIMEWLGFNWNLVEGTLELPVKKFENLKNIISALFERNIHITCRNLAIVCGKIISMLPALGSICQIMTRHLHMIISCRAYWDSFVYLNDNVIQELKFWYFYCDKTKWKQFEKLANDSRFAKIVSALPSIVEASSSKSTVKKYKFYFGKFRLWCSDCQLEFSPATATTLKCLVQRVTVLIVYPAPQNEANVDECGQFGYILEPEYTKEELQQIQAVENCRQQDIINNPRKSDTNWCSCKNCI